MARNSLSALEKSLKVSQKQNRQSFTRVAERIPALSVQQPFDYDPGDPLKNLRRDYLELARLLIRAQKAGGRVRRGGVRRAAESLVVESINFHLNFFQPNLLGLAGKGAVNRLIREMKRTFSAKNADYGNAFRFWGISGLVVRIGDKHFRLEQLTQRGYNRKVVEEKLPDTALDLANYGIMLLMLLDEGRSLKFGS